MNIVLNSFGASIRKENGLFSISTAETSQSFHPRDVKSIMVSKGARISSDAVLLAIENEIDVLFIDGLGKTKGRVWSMKYGSISTIRKKQIEFLYSSRSVDWVKEIVIEKMNNQLALLLSFKGDHARPVSRHIDNAANSISDYKSKVRATKADIVNDIAPSLRGWEGAASRRYFQCIAMCLPEKYRFAKRSKQPAQDAFNAMLNYGYGMLYGKIEGALIRAGIDPYVGVFHRDDYNRPALVFDIIEKYRVWVDYVIFHLCAQDAMSEECFQRSDNGWMLQGLGKRIVIQSVDDYMAEIIKIKGVERSRSEHIQRHAHQLAAFFRKLPHNQ